MALTAFASPTNVLFSATVKAISLLLKVGATFEYDVVADSSGPVVEKGFPALSVTLAAVSVAVMSPPAEDADGVMSIV